MDKKEFSPIEIDAIGEISNICLGNSASTLNMLVREKIDITPPRVEIIEKSEYIKEVSSKRVFVKVNYVEGLRGCSILMLEEQDAKAIADLMMGGDGNGPYAQMELGELHMSAVSEAMNQMILCWSVRLIFQRRKHSLWMGDSIWVMHSRMMTNSSRLDSVCR